MAGARKRKIMQKPLTLGKLRGKAGERGSRADVAGRGISSIVDPMLIRMVQRMG